jgi:hypothetical protein
MRKHTSGPWVAVEIGQGGPADNPMPVYEIRSADERAVIAEYVDGWNAPILAAAPELLEALQAMLLQHGVRGGNGVSAQARAAIAKATGG